MKVGINTMSTIVPMRDDFEGTVKKLRDGGCDFFENMSDWGAKQETIDFYAGFTNGPSGWDPENSEKRIEILKKYGMDARGMFIFDEVLLDQLEDLGKYCVKNGLKYVVLSFLSYGSIDDIYSKIDTIKKAAAVLSGYGVMILMHNHEHDTLPVVDKDGVEKEIIKVFLEQCSKDELMLEIDTGWLKYAGLNESLYISENLDRIAVLHFKDIRADYQTIAREDIFVACGEGCVDFAACIKAASAKEDILFVLDQDASKGDIVEDTIKSIQYIKGLQI